jgi:hypothetical protein
MFLFYLISLNIYNCLILLQETILLVASVLLQEGPPHKGKGKKRIPRLSYQIAYTTLQLWNEFSEIDLKTMQVRFSSL